jgi:hypothetical protein
LGNNREYSCRLRGRGCKHKPVPLFIDEIAALGAARQHAVADSSGVGCEFNGVTMARALSTSTAEPPGLF